MKAFKRLLSLFLAGLTLVSAVPVFAETIADGERRLDALEEAMAFWEQESECEIPKKTYYLFFPESWKFEANDYYDSSVGLESCVPAVYWYGDCTAKPDEYSPYMESGVESYPGYALTEEVAPNIYKAEIPADVEYAVWNNGVFSDKAGRVVMEGREFMAITEVYHLPEYENMICIPHKWQSNSWQYSNYDPNWFYYYGDGEYGFATTKELAGAFVYSDGEIPEDELLSAQSEVSVMLGKETVIDVNLTDTTAIVEDERVVTIYKQKDTGDWVVTGTGIGETNVIISKGEQSVTVKVKAEGSLPEVKLKKITAKNPKVAVIKWSVKGEADGYEIQMKKAGGKFRTVKTVENKNRLWAKIKGLKSATKYRFRVRAYVQGSEKFYGKYSNKKAVLTLPVKVKIRSIKAKTAHSVTLKWKKAIGADGYIILKKAKGEKSYSVTMKVSSKQSGTAVIKGLKSKQKYFFKVVSYAKVRGMTALGKASKTVKVRTPRRNTESMKFYPEFPRVPRMGYIAKTYSRYKQEIEQDGHNFVFYYYDKKQVTEWERKWYIETLKNYGFKFYEKWKNSDGNKVYSYQRKSTTVMLTENSDYIVVGIVRA